MSLFKQLLLAICAVLLVACVGNVLVSLESSREQRVDQLRAHAQDAATALALSLGSHVDDPQVVELLVSSIFDSGYFTHIRVVDPSAGHILTERSAPIEAFSAPGWFVSLINLPPLQAEALVSRGWQQAARVEVQSNPEFALAGLWRTTLASLFWLTSCAVFSALLGAWLLRRLLQPLNYLVRQAEAVSRREFHSLAAVPVTPELQPVVQAMNRMVNTLREQFQEQAAHTEALRDEAYQDVLTGLANRRAFDMQVRSRLSDEEEVRRGFLFLVQVNDLSGLNQRLGGEQADELLRTIARLLQKRCRGAGLIAPLLARIRGGEFALMLPGLLVEEAEQWAVKISEDLNVLHETGTTDVEPVVWIALVPFAAGDNVQQLLHLMNEGLSRIDSREGKHWLRLERSAGQVGLEDRQGWRERLEHALENKRFSLYFQPVVEARDPEHLLHYKVLARLPDGQGHYYTAGRFLPWLERFGWLLRFDQLMVELVLEHMTTHRLPLALSLSTASLETAQGQDALLALLRRHGQLSSRLTLELSSNQVLPAARLESLAHSLNQLGFTLGLQHFGGRFGLLGNLSRLGLAWLKIDGSYIHDIDREEDKRLFIAAIQQAASSIELPLIAEWVETPAELAVLQKIGMQGVAGRLFGEPAPWAERPSGDEPARPRLARSESGVIDTNGWVGTGNK